jgi:uncharacterized protein (DUF1499 family)
MRGGLLRRRGWQALLTLVALIAIGLLGVRLYMGREAENHIRPEEQVDFAHLALGARTNVYLLCPGELEVCNLPADGVSPIFPLDVAALHDLWLQMVASEPRVRLMSEEGQHRHLVFIVRSAALRFPDIVTVEFFPVGPDRSTLAILSRSRYGRSDFGVNARRVDSWVGKLKAAAGMGAGS